MQIHHYGGLVVEESEQDQLEDLQDLRLPISVHWAQYVESRRRDNRKARTNLGLRGIGK